MLDPAYVRDNMDTVRRRMDARGIDLSKELEQLATLESQRRRIIPQLEGLKREQNTASDEVARVKRQGGDARPIFEANKVRSQRIKQLEIELDSVEGQRSRLMAAIPNIPHDSVPAGAGAADNVVVRTWGEPKTFDFDAKAHWDLGPQLGIIDFERATKISGARFSILMGAGAQLERALINFMLHLHTTEHGYTEIEPPFLVNSATLYGTGQLPKFEQDLFKISGEWDLYLIPTAEVPVTNLYRGEILDGRLLPLKYTAYTPCFRSEAGSHGADVRGLIRQLQRARNVVRRARTTHRECGAGVTAARPALSHGVAVHRRHGVFLREDVRHRGVAAQPEGVPRDLVVFQLRSVPGAAREHQVSAARNRQGRFRAHAQRLWPRRRSHADRDSRELPAGGWIGCRA
jgi:seryl-tRNA synthetase